MNEEELDTQLKDVFKSFMGKLSEIRAEFLAGISTVRKRNDDEALSNLRKKFSQGSKKDEQN